MYRPLKYGLAISAFAMLPVLVIIWMMDIGGVSPEGNRMLRWTLTASAVILGGVAGPLFCIPDAAPDFLRHIWTDEWPDVRIWDYEGFSFMILLMRNKGGDESLLCFGQNQFDSAVDVEIAITPREKQNRGLFPRMRFTCPAGGLVSWEQRIGIPARLQGGEALFFITAAARWHKWLARELRRCRSYPVPALSGSTGRGLLEFFEMLHGHAPKQAKMIFEFLDDVNEHVVERDPQVHVLWVPGDPLPKDGPDLCSGETHRLGLEQRKPG